MSKNENQNTNAEVKVNTPIPEETKEDGFFNDEAANEDQKNEEPSPVAAPPAITSEEPEKLGFFDKGIFGWFKRHWKLAISLGLVTVVGGVVFVYWMGKKPVKIGKIDEVARDLGNEADVIDFVEAAKEIAKKDDVKETVNG